MQQIAKKDNFTNCTIELFSTGSASGNKITTKILQPGLVAFANAVATPTLISKGLFMRFSSLISTLALLFVLGFSSFSTMASEPAQDSIFDISVIKVLSSHRNYHVCHMGNVYLSKSAGNRVSRSLLWNNYTQRPLLCQDYMNYTYCLSKHDISMKKGRICFIKKSEE